jgi:hypothetical protein
MSKRGAPWDVPRMYKIVQMVANFHVNERLARWLLMAHDRAEGDETDPDG